MTTIHTAESPDSSDPQQDAAPSAPPHSAVPVIPSELAQGGLGATESLPPQFLPAGLATSLRQGPRTAPRTLPGSLHLSTSRAEAAAQRLGEIAAASTPGTRLGSKDELRAACGVSVGTFNEAIKLSLERGFVTSRPGPGGGIFAVDPPPLAMLVTWFRAATRDRESLDEALRVRDELAPLFVDSAISGIDPARRSALEAGLETMRSAVSRHEVVDTIWDAWSLHKLVAESFQSSLLANLYLSLLDVGASHLRWALLPAEPGTGSVRVWLGPFAEANAALIEALCAGDHTMAKTAMITIDPALLLAPPAGGPAAEADAGHGGS